MMISGHSIRLSAHESETLGRLTGEALPVIHSLDELRRYIDEQLQRITGDSVEECVIRGLLRSYLPEAAPAPVRMRLVRKITTDRDDRKLA